MSGTDGFAAEREPQDDAGEARKPFVQRINKKKLEEYNPNEPGKKLNIWYKNPQTGAHEQLCKPIYLDVATICSDFIFKEKVKYEKQGVKYDTITFNQHDNLDKDALKYVVNWITSCGEQQQVVNIEEEDSYLDGKEIWNRIRNIRNVARRLDIPEASFGKALIFKSMKKLKTVLPSLDFVGLVFDRFIGEPDLELQKAVATVIFEWWYSYALDDEEYDDYMYDLQLKRGGCQALDEAIQAAVEDKDRFIKDRKAKKALETAKEKDAAGSFNDSNGDSGNNGFGNDGAGYDAETATGGGEAWMDQDAVGTGAGNNWDGDNVGNGGSGDWADDVNESLTPAPVVSSNW